MELQFYRRLNPQNPKTLFTQIAPSAKTQRSSDNLPQYFNSGPTVETTLILLNQSARGILNRRLRPYAWQRITAAHSFCDYQEDCAHVMLFQYSFGDGTAFS